MTRIATFIACDQVVQAALGKLAFVGVYGGDVMLPRLPFSLEQLFFVVRLRSPIDNPPQKFVVRIERPGEEPYIMDHTAVLAQITPTPEPGSTFLDVQAIIRIAPFEVKEPGTARIFVVDEIGDNYAGGLRLSAGVHPDTRLPQIAQTLTLACGHFKRLADEPEQIRREIAEQLIEAISEFAEDSGLKLALPFPDADLRLITDEQRVHVFFPKPLKTGDYTVLIEPGPEFEKSKIEKQDRIGFIARFEPSMPAGGFNYEVVEQQASTSKPKKASKRPATKPRKNPRTK